MEGSAGERRSPVEGKAWWVAGDEGYWRAVLEQGEVALESAPHDDHQGFFSSLVPDSAAGISTTRSAVDPQNGPGSDDGWLDAQLARDQGECFSLQVCGANRGGVLVEWNGLQGFVPASHLKEMPRYQDSADRVNELSRRIGESLTLRVIEVDQRLNRLVFSERAAEPDSQPPAAILNTLEPGDDCLGKVTSLTSFGAFVDLGGVEGLIHVSEISWDRVRHPGDVLCPGESVEVRVLGVKAEERRVALSLKRMRPDPWTEVDRRFHVGQVIEGTVTNVVSFGAFVRVAEGVEGLIHISELGDGSFLHPRNVVREQEPVRVRVLNIDRDQHRLGLSLRQVHEQDLAAE